MPKVKKVVKTSPTTKNDEDDDSDEPPRKKASKRSASVAALAAITNSQEAEAVADEELFKAQPIEAKKKAVAIGTYIHFTSSILTFEIDPFFVLSL